MRSSPCWSHRRRASWATRLAQEGAASCYTVRLAAAETGPVPTDNGRIADGHWMTVGMAAWMVWRRHAWPGIAERCLAMYPAFVALFSLLWLGLLSGDGLMLAGHGVH